MAMSSELSDRRLKRRTKGTRHRLISSIGKQCVEREKEPVFFVDHPATGWKELALRSGRESPIVSLHPSSAFPYSNLPAFLLIAVVVISPLLPPSFGFSHKDTHIYIFSLSLSLKATSSRIRRSSNSFSSVTHPAHSRYWKNIVHFALMRTIHTSSHGTPVGLDDCVDTCDWSFRIARSSREPSRIAFAAVDPFLFLLLGPRELEGVVSSVFLTL